MSKLFKVLFNKHYKFQTYNKKKLKCKVIILIKSLFKIKSITKIIALFINIKNKILKFNQNTHRNF